MVLRSGAVVIVCVRLEDDVDGSDAEFGGSDAEFGGSDVKIGESNVEVILETGSFSPLVAGVSTLSAVVDSPFSSSTRSSETITSTNKGKSDVVLLELVTIVLLEAKLVGYIDEVDAGHGSE